MRRGYFLTVLGSAGLALAGCTYVDLDYVVPSPKAETNLEFATRTVAQLKTLAVGQSRHEVMARMNLEPVEGCVEWSWETRELYLRHNGYLRCIKTTLLRSPYRSASIDIDGISHEALFYFTGGAGPDGDMTDHQLTPVLIVGGKLVGWGWDHPLMKQLGPRLSTAQAAAAPAPPADRPVEPMGGTGNSPPAGQR